MRQHGDRIAPSGLGRNDHACLAYEDEAELAAAGRTYLADGVALGQRAMVVADGAAELAAGLPPEAVVHYAPDAVYGEAAGFYEREIDRALADGFTGLRTLAELTPLLCAPGAGADLARWEAQADRIMARRPWSALCCYDRRRVPAAALADVAAVHPVGCGTADLTPFHLFAAGPEELRLAGEVDTFAAPSLERVLAAHAAADPPMRLDLRDVGFADHNAALALARAGMLDREAAPRPVARVAELLGLPR